MLKLNRMQGLYVRIFLLVAFLFLTMASLYSYYLTSQISKYAINEVNDVASIKITHVKNSMELILQRLKINSTNLYQNRNVGYWLAAQDRDTYLDHLVDLSLIDFKASERLVKEVYLFNPATREILAANGGSSPFNGFSDQHFLQKIIQKPEGPLQFSKQVLNGHPEIMLFFPSEDINVTQQGRLAVVLDQKLLTEELLLDNNEFQSKLLVLDSDNSLLMGDINHTFESAFHQFLSGTNKGNHHLQEDNAVVEGFDWKYDGQEWGVQSISLAGDHWKLYLVSPLGIWKDKLFNLNLKILGSFFIMIAFLLVLLYFLSKQTFKPFVEVLQKIRGYYGGNKSMEDDMSWYSLSKGYKLIHSGFDTLVDRVEEQDRSIKSSGHIVKEELLRQWILSNKITSSLKEELGQMIQINLDEPIRFAVFRIENYSKFNANYSFQSRKLMKFAMQNIISEVVMNYGLTSESADLGSDHIVMLFSSQECEQQSETTIVTILEEAKLQLNRWIDIPAVVGLSESTTSPAADIYKVYQSAYELSKLSFITGDNLIFRQSDLRTVVKEGQVSGLDIDQLITFIQSIRVRDKDAVLKQLHTLFEELKVLPANESKLQLTQLLFTLQKSFKQIQGPLAMEDIEQKLNEFTNLREIQVWLEQLLLNLMEDMSNRHAQKEEVFTDILTYIANHLHDPMLTIDDIAHHVSLSVNYVRLIFKEHYQFSVSDYILECRIEKVKELLLETNWSIVEIAAQSGFQSKSHFFTAFKKATGMTPTQYREKRA